MSCFCIRSYEKHFSRDVGMAVPKTTATIGEGMAVFRQEMLYKDYTSNPIPPSFLKPDSGLCYMRLLGRAL